MNAQDSAESSGMDVSVTSEPSTFLEAMLIEVEADTTLGYASIQNSVPVIRSLRLTNTGSEALENIEVLVGCNPRFAEGVKLRFDRLGPNESRRISPLDLRPDRTYLAFVDADVLACSASRPGYVRIDASCWFSTVAGGVAAAELLKARL